MANINGHFTIRSGKKLLMKLVGIVLIGKCLLLIADEKDIIVYIKLATLLIILNIFLQFLHS